MLSDSVRVHDSRASDCPIVGVFLDACLFFRRERHHTTESSLLVPKGALSGVVVAPFVDFSMIPARSSSNQKSGIQSRALARAALWLNYVVFEASWL
jgi:hypothetical protein